jgi:c-di-GMP-binding flagellar brake protein YcgR
MLTQAIDRNSAAVLSLPSAGMVRYHKTRFLRSLEQRIWLESVPTERALIESLIHDGQLVVVSFKTGARKASFSSPIYHLDYNYRFFESDGTEGPLQAIEMVRPAVVKPVQRRSHYRVPVRETDQFTIQVWRIAEHVHIEDEPQDLAYLPATVRDLSVGGVGVIFMSRPLLVTDQRMRILLRHGDSPPMLLEGRTGPLRRLGDGRGFEVGIEFQNLQESLRGRQMLTELTRIVQGLQLRAMKRTRGTAG